MSGSVEALGVATGFALAGGLAGWLHFRGLRLLVERLLAGDPAAVVLHVARFAGLGLFLYFCARAGSLALLSAAAGLMAGRAIEARRARREAP